MLWRVMPDAKQALNAGVACSEIIGTMICAMIFKARSLHSIVQLKVEQYLPPPPFLSQICRYLMQTVLLGPGDVRQSS